MNTPITRQPHIKFVSIVGRYPGNRAALFRPENITVTISPVDESCSDWILRLDDCLHADCWFDIRLCVSLPDGVEKPKIDATRWPNHFHFYKE